MSRHLTGPPGAALCWGHAPAPDRRLRDPSQRLRSV